MILKSKHFHTYDDTLLSRRWWDNWPVIPLIFIVMWQLDSRKSLLMLSYQWENLFFSQINQSIKLQDAYQMLFHSFSHVRGNNFCTYYQRMFVPCWTNTECIHTVNRKRIGVSVKDTSYFFARLKNSKLYFICTSVITHWFPCGGIVSALCFDWSWNWISKMMLHAACVGTIKKTCLPLPQNYKWWGGVTND